MSNLISELSRDIKVYCENNNLDFEKVMRSGKCYGKNIVFFQHVDPDAGKDGLHNEAPAPVVLTVARTEKGVVFEQTEYTQRFLAMS